MPLLNWELQFIVPIRCNEHAQHFRGFRKALVLNKACKVLRQTVYSSMPAPECNASGRKPIHIPLT